MVGSGSTARRASRGPLARGSTLPTSPHPTLADHPGADRGRIRRPVVGTHSSGPRHLREPRVLGSGRFTRVDNGRQRCETLGRRGGIIFPLMGREPNFFRIRCSYQRVSIGCPDTTPTYPTQHGSRDFVRSQWARDLCPAATRYRGATWSSSLFPRVAFTRPRTPGLVWCWSNDLREVECFEDRASIGSSGGSRGACPWFRFCRQERARPCQSW